MDGEESDFHDKLDLILNLKERIIKLNEKTKIESQIASLNGDITKLHHPLFVNFISDSIIIKLPTDTVRVVDRNTDQCMDMYTNILDERTKNSSLAMSFITFFSAISQIWQQCILKGFTIRGGIEYGSFYWTEKDVIGPAYINAYNLESKDADISRILCGDSFMKFFNEIFPAHNPYVINQGPRNFMLDHYCKPDRPQRDWMIINPNIIFKDDGKSDSGDLYISKVCEMMEENPCYKEKYCQLHEQIKDKNVNERITKEEISDYVKRLKA